MTPAEFIRKQTRRRRRGKVIPPLVGFHTWRPYPTTTPYGATGNPAWSLGRHTGEDHAAPTGARVVSVSWGTVVCVARWKGPGAIMGSQGPVRQWGDAYGTHVVVRTGSGRYDVAYCHLSAVHVQPGDRVAPGLQLGLSGNSGGSGTFGPHLHLEVRPAGGRFGSDVHPIHAKRMGRG
jgi:murein DD-endopeptidase MepM/ murein hydrolase activator NlpD